MDVKNEQKYFWSLGSKDEVEWSYKEDRPIYNESLGECKMAWLFNEELVSENFRISRVEKIRELISKLEKIGL